MTAASITRHFSKEFQLLLAQDPSARLPKSTATIATHEDLLPVDLEADEGTMEIRLSGSPAGNPSPAGKVGSLPIDEEDHERDEMEKIS